ncbi:serine/threonine-protein phosphatase 7 long form [Dorcoceras hygrometricum]|uniref:Serine/threonine-protein phosphatase 7 long form n=1 Tax=Dorcoceras hygrometricum TaxID=472368 RepID=A0A2Z7AQH6_9LAMI|nr:serine/threonine-protein phosphatase 7 long form [Dorcoceras hygrometricum]
MTPLCPDRLGYNLIASHENPNYSDNVLPIPPYGARWKHAYCWTHTPTHSVRNCESFAMYSTEWEIASLVVETEYAVNFCMTDEYATWYDLITRRFISPIDPVQLDSGYQPGDAYFRRVMRDGTSNIANICSGGNVQADQGTPYQQSEFQTPPPYTAYQSSFMEIIFDGIPHQYEGEQPTFYTSAIPYMGYSLPESVAMPSSHVSPEYTEECEDDDDYQAPNINVGANVCHVRLIVVLVIV